MNITSKVFEKMFMIIFMWEWTLKTELETQTQ